MEQALQFFRTYEIWIYVILGVLALWQCEVRPHWEEYGAYFGMGAKQPRPR
jgi:hypothetical protein